jgi:putative flavoprotein involved in K+ transport
MESLPASVDTLVVGAGQAGLAISRLLTGAGRDHLVLDRRDRLGGGWHDRWDSFCLVTPNAVCRLPGFAYDGDAPGGFMPRDDVVAMLERYAASFDAPVALGTEVQRVARRADGSFDADTSRGGIRAGRVVVAAGGFHRPHVPAMAASLDTRVTQLHSQAYRNPGSLPPGGVLVVGSGQSGGQIAEELHQAGRHVVLATGSSGWLPRRYRGADLFTWFSQVMRQGASVGVPPPTVDDLPSPRARFAGNPMMSGKGGGHDIDLRRLAREGMTLAGHVAGIDGERVSFSPDLHASLRHNDRMLDERYKPLFDRYIAAAGIDAPPDERSAPEPFEPDEPSEIHLADAGVATVIWTTGYRLDFSWIDLPIFDDMGYPAHRRGVSEVPGLVFLGLPWMHTQASPTFMGLEMDAAHVFEALEPHAG